MRGAIEGRNFWLQILLQDSGVFEMLTIAQELGVEELRISCEEHVTSTLSILNACTFLSAGMEIQDRSPGKHICLFHWSVGFSPLTESSIFPIRQQRN